MPRGDGTGPAGRSRERGEALDAVVAVAGWVAKDSEWVENVSAPVVAIGLPTR